MSSTPKGSDLSLAFWIPVLGCTVLVTLLIVINRRVSLKSYDNPALMQKLYRSVPNDAIYADLTPYGLGEIRIGTEK